jgi:hypothetical protein
MAFVTKTDIGLKESIFFNHHRFDNHSSWLDREIRNKRRLRGEPAGHGFAIPREPAPARQERPFIVQEYGMTSGLLLKRRYAQRDTDYPLECERSDPYHFPNHLQVENAMHYEDRRARSQHIDPRVRAKNEIPRDKVLRDAVPEEMVKNIIAASGGDKDMKNKPDPDVMAIQFDPNMRLQKETVKELNVDLSCCDLPAREKPDPITIRRSTDVDLHAGEQVGKRRTDVAQSRPIYGRDWNWCLGGRRPVTPPNHGCVEIHKSTSLPGMLSGKSLLSHQPGAVPGAFHGSTYSASEANARMRGGRNAEGGVAGTFPDREARRPGI